MTPNTTLAPPLPRLLRASEVARQIGISKQRVYELTGQGMPAIRFGRALRFDPEKVEAWLAAGGTASEGAGG